MSVTSPVWTSETEDSELARTRRSEPVSRHGRWQDGSSGEPHVSEGLDAVANFFDLEPEIVAAYLTEHDGNPRIEIEIARLGRTRAEQIRAVTLLLIASRQVGGYDAGSTDASVVRAECARLGVLDTNFSSYVTRLKPLLVLDKSGHRLAFRLGSAGQTRARSLMTAIAQS
jgi:hypothetical protein